MSRSTNKAGDTLQQSPEKGEYSIYERENDIKECLNDGKERLEDAL
jgi:hypothetical protein